MVAGCNFTPGCYLSTSFLLKEIKSSKCLQLTVVFIIDESIHHTASLCGFKPIVIHLKPPPLGRQQKNLTRLEGYPEN